MTEAELKNWVNMMENLRRFFTTLDREGALQARWNIDTALSAACTLTELHFNGATEFPLYAMMADEHLRLLPLQEAGVLYDSGWMKVDFAGFVIEEGFMLRRITEGEMRQISDIADEYSASK